MNAGIIEIASQPKVDPVQRLGKALISEMKWRLGGVTIGADDAPLRREFANKVTLITF